MPIKEITIQSHFIMVGGALIDLGKVWSGSMNGNEIKLFFMGGGKLEIYHADVEDIPIADSTIVLDKNLFYQLRAYLTVNLKLIEIV
jgi:hypothetical protein